MKLYGVQILVEDFAAAKQFYADTLGLPVAWEIAELKAIGFDVGTAQFIVTEPESESAFGAAPGRFLGVSMQVEDIDAVYADLTAKGVVFEGAPEPQPWGGTLAYLRDPSGNILTLMA